MVISAPKVSLKQDGRNIYVIMITMCPPVYQHNGFMATHAIALHEKSYFPSPGISWKSQKALFFAC